MSKTEGRKQRLSQTEISSCFVITSQKIHLGRLIITRLTNQSMLVINFCHNSPPALKFQKT